MSNDSYNWVFKHLNKFPKRDAIFAEGRYYTYQELNNHIANFYNQLCQLNQEPKRIGILCEDNFWTVAAICAVMKFGAAYVPILKDSPQERQKWIIEDTKLDLILLENETDQITEFDNTLVLAYDSKLTQIVGDLIPKIEFSEAFILYTSGSTGQPKGVPVTKKGLDHCFEWLLTYFNFNESDRFLQPFRWTFDISVFSLLTPLSVGACCYLMPKHSSSQSLIILDCLQKYSITVVCLVPSIISLTKKYLPTLKIPSLRYSLFGGEALYNNFAKIWQSTFVNAQIVNMYGPSETTIYMTFYKWKFSQSELESNNNIVPLGKVLPNHEYILLDEDKAIEKKNTTGELCISGVQVIQNYVNQIHSEKFFNHIFNGEEKRFYKTGDLVQINDFGNLVFIGRNDEQVQLQGHRVEIKEIEFQLSSFTNSEAAIVVKNKNTAASFLIGYIEKTSSTKEEIKNHLKQYLPNYMIPKKITFLENLPRNNNGKIDKKALQAI